MVGETDLSLPRGLGTRITGGDLSLPRGIGENDSELSHREVLNEDCGRETDVPLLYLMLPPRVGGGSKITKK